MRRRFIFILIGQSLVILISLMYGFVQKAEADRQTLISIEEHERAIENERKYSELISKVEDCL